MWKKIGVGAALLGTTAFAPVVPQDMQFAYAYQFDPADVQATATSTPRQARFKDDDRNGVVSVAVFLNRKGEAIEVQIPDAKYNDMAFGKTEDGKGFNANPKRDEYVSILEATTPKADAAIAFQSGAVASGTNGGVGTSFTVALDMGTGSDLFLVCYSWANNALVTGTTYNGVSMSLRETIKYSTTNETLNLFGLANPATGSNNVTISASGGSEIFGMCAGYTGVYQDSSAAFVETNEGETTGTSITLGITPSVADSWVTAASGGQRNASASTNLTARAGNGTQGAIADSNGTVSGATNFTFSISAGLRQLMIAASLQPSASAATGEEYMILFD